MPWQLRHFATTAFSTAMRISPVSLWHEEQFRIIALSAEFFRVAALSCI
jgi:hypothetical protein